VKALATDAVGNVSDESSTTTFTIDTQPPDLAPTLISPSDNKLFGVSQPLRFSGTAGPNALVGLLIDGSITPPLASATAEATWQSSFIVGPNGLALTDGLHFVTAFSQDLAGNRSLSEARYFRLDTTKPNVPSVSMPPYVGAVFLIQGTADPASQV